MASSPRSAAEQIRAQFTVLRGTAGAPAKKRRRPSEGDGYYCRIGSCSKRRGGPEEKRYETRGGLGSHRRRVHGLASTGYRERRPAGGEIPCPWVDPMTGERCSVKPYKTRGGLGTHLLRAHKLPSENPKTIARRSRRARARGESSPPPPLVVTAPRIVPQPPGPERRPVAAPANRRLGPGARRALCLRLRRLFQQDWSREFGVSAEVLRDTVGELCAANLALPEEARSRVDPESAWNESGIEVRPNRVGSRG